METCLALSKIERFQRGIWRSYDAQWSRWQQTMFGELIAKHICPNASFEDNQQGDGLNRLHRREIDAVDWVDAFVWCHIAVSLRLSNKQIICIDKRQQKASVCVQNIKSICSDTNYGRSTINIRETAAKNGLSAAKSPVRWYSEIYFHFTYLHTLDASAHIPLKCLSNIIAVYEYAVYVGTCDVPHTIPGDIYQYFDHKNENIERKIGIYIIVHAEDYFILWFMNRLPANLHTHTQLQQHDFTTKKKWNSFLFCFWFIVTLRTCRIHRTIWKYME